jgi:CHAD domain-containing protein
VDPSEKAIHDLRVATRRLLALQELIRELMPDAPVRQLRRGLKDQLDGLDPLRDTQVMLQAVEQLLVQFPVLTPFREHLVKSEEELQQFAIQNIKNISFSAISKNTSNLLRLRSYLEGAVDPGDPLAAADNAFVKATQRASEVDASQPGSFHRLRIGVKRLRYMMEVVKPLLSTAPKGLLKALADYQDALGRIQDASVLLAALEVFRRTDASLDLGPVEAYYREMQNEAISQFLEQQSGLGDFWRSGPGQPFPWEQTDEPLDNPTRDRDEQGGLAEQGRQPAPAH